MDPALAVSVQTGLLPEKRSSSQEIASAAAKPHCISTSDPTVLGRLLTDRHLDDRGAESPRKYIYIYIEREIIWRAGTTQFLKKRSKNGGANENLSYGFPSIPGIAPGVAPRIVVFVLLKSWDAIPRMGFRFPRMEFGFRELLREYPGTLRELREWPFHSESVFPEIGVVPRLLN